MRYFPLFALLLQLALAGCAKDQGNSTHDESLPVLPSVSLEEAQTMARDALVSCERNCHPAVGMLSMAGRYGRGWGASQCTASLVAPDLAVTNGHCVPEELSAPGSDCKERIWLTFPESPGHPEYDRQLRCSQVVYRRRDDDIHGADYAYLRLEKASKRPPLTFSREGMSDGETYLLQKVNPVHYSHRVGGLLQSTKCRAIFDTAVYERLLDNRSTSILLTDCVVIPGNSGGPLLAADGSLRGVIYAFIKKDRVHDELLKRGAAVPAADEIADLNIGTNFACLNSPFDQNGRDIPNSCGAPSADREAAVKVTQRERILKGLNASLDSLMKKHGQDEPGLSAFRWTLDNPPLEARSETVLGLPGCVQNTSSAIPFALKPKRLHRPTFRLSLRLNRYLEPFYQAEWAGLADAEESLHLEANSSENYYVMSLYDSAGQLEKTLPLPACPGNG